MLPHRPLGSSGIDVSVLSLGSWMTFEHIPRERGLAVMLAAREAGIDFLDDARYDDRTGTAPIPTGYSEVVFGELFRAAGWRRDDVVVANKLWLEHWPAESVRDELDGSLSRMGFDHLDLVYCAPPPDGLALTELVGSVGDLISSGKAWAWGVLNWPASLVRDAQRAAAGEHVPGPCAAQLPYSVVQRTPVEDPALVEVFREAGVGVVASAVLAGGVLTGKYESGDAVGRVAGRRDAPELQRARAAAARLRVLAKETSSSPAALAVAFALANPIVVSVLFGATTPQQVAENAGAAQLPTSLGAQRLADLRGVGDDPSA